MAVSALNFEEFELGCEDIFGLVCLGEQLGRNRTAWSQNFERLGPAQQR